MAMVGVPFFLFRVNCLKTVSVSALTCLGCDNVIQPRHCHRIANCKADEVRAHFVYSEFLNFYSGTRKARTLNTRILKLLLEGAGSLANYVAAYKENELILVSDLCGVFFSLFFLFRRQPLRFLFVQIVAR